MEKTQEEESGAKLDLVEPNNELLKDLLNMPETSTHLIKHSTIADTEAQI